jgi:glycosyltransferase involved in cell wall biosynthesis
MLDPWFKETYPVKHLKKSLFWPVQHQVLRDACAVLFTTEEERLLARESFRPYNISEVVVPYGTSAPPADSPAQQIAFQGAVPEAADNKVLLYLSRIHVKKGIDLLIEAFAETMAHDPQWLLVIAGPDQESLKPQLEALATMRGIGHRIRWPGMLVGDAKWGALRKAAAYILPSHQENFGIAVAEAMACQTPVLITNKVNIWREVEAGGGGLVEADTQDGVQRLLSRFQALSDDEVQIMGAKALETFESRFDVGPMAQGLLEVISKLAPRHV